MIRSPTLFHDTTTISDKRHKKSPTLSLPFPHIPISHQGSRKKPHQSSAIPSLPHPNSAIHPSPPPSTTIYRQSRVAPTRTEIPHSQYIYIYNVYPQERNPPQNTTSHYPLLGIPLSLSGSNNVLSTTTRKEGRGKEVRKEGRGGGRGREGIKYTYPARPSPSRLTYFPSNQLVN